MAIAIYSQSELRNFASMPRAVRASKLAKFSIKEALIFRRNIQMSMSKYAAIHRQGASFDPTVAGAYQGLHDLETLARRAFVRAHLPAMRSFAGGDKQKYARARSTVLAAWEKLLAKSSY